VAFSETARVVTVVYMVYAFVMPFRLDPVAILVVVISPPVAGYQVIYDLEVIITIVLAIKHLPVYLDVFTPFYWFIGLDSDGCHQDEQQY
jgi:hypothetical protein